MVSNILSKREDDDDEDKRRREKETPNGSSNIRPLASVTCVRLHHPGSYPPILWLFRHLTLLSSPVLSLFFLQKSLSEERVSEVSCFSLLYHSFISHIFTSFPREERFDRATSFIPPLLPLLLSCLYSLQYPFILSYPLTAPRPSLL